MVSNDNIMCISDGNLSEDQKDKGQDNGIGRGKSLMSH